jgi:hypothetical protein
MYAFSYEVPGNRMFYERINNELGPKPEDLLVTWSSKRPAGSITSCLDFQRSVGILPRR